MKYCHSSFFYSFIPAFIFHSGYVFLNHPGMYSLFRVFILNPDIYS